MKEIKKTRKTTNKRKSVSETPETRLIKKTKNEEEDNVKSPVSSDEDEQELREPTVEEINESTKPDNVYSVPSIRAKQKKKHKKNVEQKKSKNKMQNKAVLDSYIKTWKEDFSNWKYKKLIQIEIVSKMFDEEVISAEIWPIVVEYLKGSEGKAKNRIIEQAENEISKLDEQIESGKKDLLKSIIYSRARELLQMLS